MHPYLLRSLSNGPTVMQRIVRLIPADRYDAALIAERFTIREVIAHLADWEPLFRGRMEIAFATPNAKIVSYDEGQRALDLKYAEANIDVQLELFATERAKTKAFVSKLDPVQVRQQYVHPELGPMTIEDQANMLIAHDMYHIEQLSAYLTA